MRTSRIAVGTLGAIAVVAFGWTALGTAGCSNATTPATSTDEPSVPYNPQFEPDINTMQPRPGVEPATKDEQARATVKPDSLEFQASEVPSVRDWQPGRIVVSDMGGAANPLGYARKVVAVNETADGKIVVDTEPARLDDLVEGEIGMRLDNRDGADLDLTKLDPEWAAKVLYAAVPYETMGVDPLKSDPSLSDTTTTPGGGLCCGLDRVANDLGNAANAATGTASQSVDQAIKQLNNVTVTGQYSSDGIFVRASVNPSLFQAAGEFDKEIRLVDTDTQLLKDWSFEKTIDRAHMTVFAGGNLTIQAKSTFNPGFRFQAAAYSGDRKIDTFVGVQVDALSKSRVRVFGNFEAGIKAADIGGSKYGTKQLQDMAEKGSAAAEEALTKFRKELFGNEDVKPEGSITKTLWISSPKSFTFSAGPVPVVVTSTLQLDLICSFEAKAKLTYDVSVDAAANLKFEAAVFPYRSGRERLRASEPKFIYDWRTNKQILGAGEISVGCGLAPRVNVFLYDQIGVNVGIRGGLKGKVEYESKCSDNSTTPDATLTLGLYGTYGVRVGARVQAVGSSLLGKAGQELGIDIGPFEPWNDEKEIKSWSWEFPAGGVGYCTPLCRNGVINDEDADPKGKETDVDCGGGSCTNCALGKKCALNSDCAGNGSTCNGGVCAVNPCQSGVKDGYESDVDCGGTCSGCAAGRTCFVDSDCASGFCALATHKCVASSCQDGRQSSGECGLDCGGPCAKCATGLRCGDGAQCQTGISNGLYCVATRCQDGVRSGTETDVDCGGANECNRCGIRMACAVDSDCQGGYVCSGAKCIVRPDPSPTCTDRLKNQDESDVDCGGAGCDRCAAALRCKVASDCASASCLDGRCAGRYTVGGTITGLAGSVTLTAGGQSITLTNDGPFSFPTQITQGAPYAVTVSTQPRGQTCVVQNGNGTLGAANVSNVLVTCTKNTYTVGGTVTGLTRSGLVLRNNGGNDLNVAASGAFTFTTAVTFGSAYAVTVATQPSGATCNVQNGTGTMGAANVTNVTVTCTSDSYTVGGTVSGLTSGTLVLRNNGGNDLGLTANGTFTFTSPVTSGAGYAVTVASQPAGLSCAVQNGVGTVSASNVTNVAVVCSANTYAVGGSVSGLTSGSMILHNNASDALTVSANGTFTFLTPIASGSTYDVRVASQPSGQTCIVQSGSGTVASAPISNVSIACTPNAYTIGGTVSGLVSGTVSLQDNGGSPLDVSANGSFTFAASVPFRQTYDVTISGNPSGQTCTVQNGAGTVGAGNVTNVSVTCTRNAYTVGGVVSGLTGTVVLRNNGGNDLSWSSNGAFTFTQSVPFATTYNVTVATNPSGQVCSVTGASGTMGASNVTDVVISCSSTALSIGGSVSGLPAGYTITLANSAAGGGETVNATGSGVFNFSQTFSPPKAYNVVVNSQPSKVSCSVTNGSGTANATVTNVQVTCTESFKYIFVTDGTWNGALGGLSGADAKCQAAATAAGRPGTYKAWLSASPSTHAKDRVTQATVPYRLFDGTTQVAANFTGLVSGTLAHAINVTETLATKSIAVWSNTTSAGLSIGAADCSGWNGLSGNGQNGDSSATSSGWTQAGGLFCTSQFALYCLEQ